MDELSPTELFKDLVNTAISRQQIRAAELTRYYLVDLLCRFLRPDQRILFADDSGKPLALRLGQALESSGLEQRARLRNLGDFSLFMSGFFSAVCGRGLLRLHGRVRVRLAGSSRTRRIRRCFL